MKHYFLVALYILTIQLNGQAPETLLVNNNHHLTLFFHSPIRQAITGAENFTFSYNKDEPQYFGLLQANPGNVSNLLVITMDGRIYNYGLEYQKSMPETYRFIKVSESIGLENPTMSTSLTLKKKKTAAKKKPVATPNKYREEYFKKFSAYHLEHNRSLLKSKRKKGVILRLTDLIYNQNEVYAILEIENRSKIDFELDYLKIFKVNGNRRRKSSYQKLELKPLYTYMVPKIIKIGKSKKFVYVLPKFTLGDTEKLLLEFQEFQGNRILQLFHE